MTAQLPPNLLALFAPRPPLRYAPHMDYAPQDRHSSKVTGVAGYLEALKNYDDGYKPTESWQQRRDRIKYEKKEKHEKTMAEGKDGYDPANDPNVRGDAFKTLFVGRISYDTEPRDLQKEFGRFGPIERIRIVTDTRAGEKKASRVKKNRGYAFILFEREKDMKAAYKETDGIRIRDRRILVDVERGRTVNQWKPRRLGGGLGGRGYTKALPAKPAIGFGGPPPGPGFRGGFGGGMRGGRGDFGGGFRGGRGGFRGDRGGFGDRGFGGGDRGGFGGGGGRGGIGYQSNGWGAPPEGAPSGPRGGGRGGFGGGSGGGSNGDYDRGDRGERRFDDRGGGSYGGGGGRDRGSTGANREPLGKPGFRDRDGGGGYGGGGRDDDRKRRYDGGDGYGDDRSKRRF
ncbi:RNA-binding domain-containing protein [Pseudovirgaria hyperparasitica]|uniref:RNA-binding domain-containing protein n=1 Tax=Pseudovirgaria hyperparasitica TaxID=470096 RepID=A0A6A6WKH4_9PEZI|nr:RNA-binding domain-containing protein [Pseudovirgaria hyperparasitica]KAF2762695.1 RNA-binding domain-containing protein [Pseudovirgaria hyperparasitica]